MQAKKVFEVQNFERGQNPRKLLDLGGIVLEKETKNRIEEIRKAKKNVEDAANQEWKMYLQKILVGKKITARMTSLQTMDMKTHILGERVTKDFTITVQEVSSQDLSDLLINIAVADTDHNMYALSLDEKIYFE